MFFFLSYFIKSFIFDYTVPRIFDTIEDYAKYNPNLYNYEIIRKKIDFDQCLNGNKKQLKECIDFSLKKFYSPFSLITKNNPPNNNLYLFFNNKSSNPITKDMKIKNFWLRCAQKGNSECAQLYDTFNFFNIENYPEEYVIDQKEENISSIFIQLKEAHNLMYKIKLPQKIILENTSNIIKKSSNNTETQLKEHLFLHIQNNTDAEYENNFESEDDREIRFKKVYEILKPIAFLAFDKYIKDHFGYLRPLRRINQTLVEDMLGNKRSYQHELKILLEGKEKTKDPSWIFEDLNYPAVARLFLDIVTRRKEGPEKPLNEIYSNLLTARFPYLFEEGFDSKERFTNSAKNLNVTKTQKNDQKNDNFHFLNSFLSKSFFLKNLNKIVDIQKVVNKKNDDMADNENEYGFFEYDNDEDENENEFDEFVDGNEKEKIEENEEEANDENDDDDLIEFYYGDDEESSELHEYIYDYYFNNNSKKSNKKIFMKKKNLNEKKIQSHSNSSNFFTNFGYELNYTEIAKMRLQHALDLCRNYLSNLKNIEGVNQSNLTVSISTILGISSLFHQDEAYEKDSPNNQTLKQMHFFDEFDANHDLIGCKFFDEGLYYLMIAAKNGGIKAAEALLYKFLLLITSDKKIDQKIIDNYFNYVINCLDQMQQLNPLNDSVYYLDDFGYKTHYPNIYIHFHDLFPPLVKDFFDAIIFFDKRCRELFQVDQITTFNTSFQLDQIFETKNENLDENLNRKPLNKFNESSEKVEKLKNPRNWTYEDAAKALRAFIDSSLFVQVGHMAEDSLSYLDYVEGSRKICFSLIDKFLNLFFENKSENNNNRDVTFIDDDEITINKKKINKRVFLYALRVYQTLAMAGNRDAMWNTHILMKAANKPSQIFTMFITDSNETVFLHELDARHRRSKILKNSEIKNQSSGNSDKEFETSGHNRTIGHFVYNYLSSCFAFLFESIQNLLNISSNNTTSLIYSNQIDYDFYEEISDRDPYAAFTLAWKKRGNLTAAFELLDKTENMKPEATVAVVISKLIITTLSFINTVFKQKTQTSITSPPVTSSTTNSTSFNIFQRIFSMQKYEKISEFVKSTPYLPEILLGSGILSALAFFIYIRIFLYCDE